MDGVNCIRDGCRVTIGVSGMSIRLSVGSSGLGMVPQGKVQFLWMGLIARGIDIGLP